jgi:methyl-accepting chemotaxis protein
LGAALNTMRDSFIKMIKSIMQSSEQVAASSQQLTASAEQCAQATNQVAASITDEIENLIETVTTRVHQMSKAIQEVATGSKQIVSSVHDIESISKNTAGQTQTPQQKKLPLPWKKFRQLVRHWPGWLKNCSSKSVSLNLLKTNRSRMLISIDANKVLCT